MRRLVLGVLALLVAVGGVALWQVSRARCFALVGPAICHVQTSAPLVALTFDDGPTPLGVDAILPVLADHGATATFFLIGQDMARHPGLASRLVDAGQEIANHSYSHPRLVGRSAAFYDHEIARTEALLTAAGGRARLFRPPYAKKLVGLPLAVRRHGLRMVLWDVEDPAATTPQAFARQVVAEARPGSIILLHAMYPANVTARQALPLILDGLEAKGLRAVSVGALLVRADGPA
jgi:peptidoglycan/xylan/chitin deacetylase (PgdA/CDA1 family)